MIKKEGFKTVETDLEELEEKIHDHRKKIFKRIVITIIAVLAVFAAAQLWMALRSYDSYDIKNSVLFLLLYLYSAVVPLLHTE